MSKCQRNKYFNGSGASSKTLNPEFSASLASLMNARESQDRMFSAPAPAPSSTASNAQNQLVSVKSTPTPKKDNSEIIDIILAGDFE